MRHLPDAPASHCVPRLPGEPLRPMKWVIIIETWYKRPTQEILTVARERSIGLVPGSNYRAVADPLQTNCISPAWAGLEVTAKVVAERSPLHR